VARPFRLAAFHESRPVFRAMGVQGNITHQFKQIRFLIAKSRAIATLKDMADQAMGPIKIVGISAQKALHESRHIRIRRFDKEVKMIRHETPLVELDVMPITEIQQQFFKFLIVGGAVE